MGWKASLALILLMLVIIFTLQNYEVVQVKFLLWQLEASRAVVLFLTLLTGFIIGLVASFIKHNKE